jgi:hypothetical protein
VVVAIFCPRYRHHGVASAGAQISLALAEVQPSATCFHRKLFAHLEKRVTPGIKRALLVLLIM